MPLNADSSTVEFYRESIDALLIEMGKQIDEQKIDQLHGQILRLTARMADAAFNDIRNRTRHLAALVADLRRITTDASSGPSAAGWIQQLTSIADLAGTVVTAATGATNGSPA
jgi:class 3 adenylate cyclase